MENCTHNLPFTQRIGWKRHSRRIVKGDSVVKRETRVCNDRWAPSGGRLEPPHQTTDYQLNEIGLRLTGDYAIVAAQEDLDLMLPVRHTR